MKNFNQSISNLFFFKNIKQKTFLFCFLFFLICFLPSWAQANEAFNNAEGYARSLKAAQQAEKPLLIYFYTNWCPYCRKFEKKVLTDPKVIEKMSEFIFVQIDAEAGPGENKLAQLYQVRGYPALYFQSYQNGSSAHYAASASRNPQEFVRSADRFLAQTQNQN